MSDESTATSTISAATPGDAAMFASVLREELRLIRLRRGLPSPSSGAAGTLTKDAQDVSAFGVAFSGGGIRSATFNLGVAQGLAERNLWPHVDYLSTVSGGGFIGSWLHGIVRSKHDVLQAPPPPGGPAEPRQRVFAEVHRTLLAGVDRVPGGPDRDPIAFLRKYSNYLTPRTGLFSADTWVGVVIWIRNVLLNQLILAPAIAVVAALVLLCVLLRQLPVDEALDFGASPIAAGIAVLGFLLAIAVMALNLNPIARNSFSRQPVELSTAEALAARFLPVVILGLSVAVLAVGLGEFDPKSTLLPALAGILLIILMSALQYFGGFTRCFAERHKHPRWRILPGRVVGLLHVAWMSVVSGVVTAALIWSIWRLTETWDVWLVVAFAPPLVGVGVILGVMLLVGLMGADYPDAAREWTARSGSRVAMLVVGWTVLFGLVVGGPPFVAELVHRLPRVGPAAIAMWLATTFGGVLAGRSPDTGNGRGRTGRQRVLETLVSLAPTMFLVAYLIAISAGAQALLARFSPPAALSTAPDVASDGEDFWRSPYAQDYWRTLTVDYEAHGARQVYVMLLLLGGFALVAVVAASRINVNEFSLHHFYKNRLVRCYLGASRARARRANAFTGFDPADDFPLASLSPDPAVGDPYYGPYPIVNATLNLNAGSELALQERKAASFVFTPAYSGFERQMSDDDMTEATKAGMTAYSFRATYGYSQPSGPDLGTAMAISGAAANPNGGYHTSGPMAFLLTMFDARLGWWLGNPRWTQQARQPGPVFALPYLLAELLGQTTGVSKYVNLSDGGHFENLGLYELVRRRCRFIIVCDAEQDGALTFGSLGDAIRRCRADFGVEITIDPSAIHRQEGGYSTAHCVVGRIRYPEEEQSLSAGSTAGCAAPSGGERSRGWVLYLKSSLTGDEPTDVLEYRSRYHEFPHQSTADQFFSESQFESYRRLGLHVLRSTFEGVGAVAPQAADVHGQQPLVRLFQDLTRRWYAPIPVTPEAASRLADAYTTLMQALAAKKETEPLFIELQTGASSGFAEDPLPVPLLSAVTAVLQLMENVYTEFDFEQPLNAQNPRNGGWMATFRIWAQSAILFEQAWPALRQHYHRGFQEFVDNLRTPRATEGDVL